MIQLGSFIRIRKRNPGLYPNSDQERQTAPQIRKTIENMSNTVICYDLLVYIFAIF
jgi:hypothetical protein